MFVRFDRSLAMTNFVKQKIQLSKKDESDCLLKNRFHNFECHESNQGEA